MPKKKTDETGEVVDAAENNAAEANSEDGTETKPKRNARKAKDATEDASVVETVLETAASAVETVASTISEGATKLADAVAGSPTKTISRGKRAEKIGVVASDKMTKTVVVRVDRLIKHPVYRKYVRKRKKFMAHDEFGAKIGDKVRIVETRPLSARKRWRVVEIIQRAEL
jgi:small subunit ribosomal protein S17